jgi:hypothetical protein
MKNHSFIALCVSVLLFNVQLLAQDHNVPLNEPDYNKPLLFRSLPDSIPVDIASFDRAVSFSAGENVSVNISDNIQFPFDGKVMSTASKYGNSIQSVVIKSNTYDGAGLTISKITESNGNIFYTGRIVSMKSGDLYELVKTNSGYFLVKRKFYDLINE